jgi:hypothetical protein
LKNPIIHITCILLFSTNPLIGQADSISTITYISKVPMVVQTSTYRTLLNNNKVLQALGSDLKLALLPRKLAVTSDFYFNLDKPLPIEQYKNIEYNTTSVKHPDPHWHSLDPRKNDLALFPFNHLLTEWKLDRVDTGTITFRNKNTKSLVQQYSFVRPLWLPLIAGYRQKSMTDTLHNRLLSQSANDKKKKWIGYDSVRAGKITVAAGEQIELLIKKRGLNKDSSLEYRLYTNEEQIPKSWKHTGHLLSLDSLQSDEKYTLEIRYRDMELSQVYHIETLPYWYQSPLGRYSLMLVGISLLLAGPWRFYHYRLNRESRRRKQLEEQLTSMHSQLNPHFVFNALSSIEGLVSSQENERANEYLSSFSDIMRDTLKNSRELLISLSQELDTLEKYLRVEQLRFEFRWTLQIDPELDLDAIEFPPMLLQPVVENAIRHGVASLGRDGEIKITCLKKGNDLIIRVLDNGGCRKKKNTPGQGYGLKITEERMQRLKELYKREHIHFTLDPGDEKTTAEFYFENWIVA